MMQSNVTHRRIDVHDVQRIASGRWGQVFRALAPELEHAMARPGSHVPCPVHGGEDGFRLFHDYEDTGGGICNSCENKKGGRGFFDGFALLMWLKQWEFPKALEQVADCLGIDPRNPGGTARRSSIMPVNVLPSRPKVAQHLRRSPEQDQELLAWINQIWSDAVSIDDPAAEPGRRYLASRKISLRVARTVLGMRFHPALEYMTNRGQVIGAFPGFVCELTDKADKRVTLHRTYLSLAGTKAEVEEPKKLMPVPNGMVCTGGAIRLVQPQKNVLSVCEGLEDALTVMTATGWPAWPVGNAVLLQSFVPPPEVDTLVIWVDKDRSGTGENAARLLSERMAKECVRTKLLVPPLPIPDGAKSVDWNDVWCKLGHDGFPSKRLLASLVA